MLYHFLSISVIVIFSVLAGILVNVFLNDYGILVAIAFYSIMFLVDYITTVRQRDYYTYETNPLFGILSKVFPAKVSFAIIFATGITVNVLLYVVINDVILCYVLGMCHLCMGINNYHISRKLDTLQQREEELKQT